MAHVMSSQLLWPTTAKTESPRKEQTDSLRLLFNDVTTQWATLSNNDPWAIWEICSYDSLLIDLKISSHTCWPFRAGVGRAPTPSLEWSQLCLDSLTWLVILVPVTIDQAVNTGSGSLGDCALRFSYSGLCWQFERIIFQPCWRVIKTEIGCFANGVTRELVSSFFGMSPRFYGLSGQKVSGTKKATIE